MQLTLNRKPTGPASKRLTRRAYSVRVAEREFTAAVLSVELTPQVLAHVEAAQERAAKARTAPFLQKYRITTA